MGRLTLGLHPTMLAASVSELLHVACHEEASSIIAYYTRF
jgi:hypothetical protein